MSNQKLLSSTRVGIAAAALVVLGIAAPPLATAQTNGMERRDDRDDNRDERRDDRDECREAEGAGKDKRDCKQEERRDGNDE